MCKNNSFNYLIYYLCQFFSNIQLTRIYKVLFESVLSLEYQYGEPLLITDGTTKHGNNILGAKVMEITKELFTSVITIKCEKSV